MYKVLVVDDEPRIRRGLCRLVESYPLPLEVCAQAGDGAAAAQLAMEHRPDIVLLDICMPHMDGLELLHVFKKDKMHTKSIIITGFDEFSFAKASVSLNAFAYLLKPIDEDELLAQLTDAIAELEAEQAGQEQSRMALDQIGENQWMFRQIFGLSWLKGMLTPQQIQAQLAFWQIQWPEQVWVLVIKPAFKRIALANRQEQDLMLYGVNNIAEDLLEPLGTLLHCFDDSGYDVAVLRGKPDGALCQALQEDIRKKLQLQCYVDTVELKRPEGLADTFSALRGRLEQCESVRPLIQSIRDHLLDNFHNPRLSLTDVAGALCVSQSYLCKLLKNELHTTFVEYLTKLRLEEAVRLLLETDLKLNLVAQQVGFQNQHYFSTVFKKNMGVSPSVYREQQGVAAQSTWQRSRVL